MKISTRLRLAVFVPALMALVIIAALVFSYQDMGKIQKNGGTVRQIRSSITELNHFVFSYILYHEERPKEQFLAEHDVLTRLIAGAQLQNPDQQRFLDSISEDSITMKDLFSQLVSNYERDSTAGTDELRGAEDRLVGLLLLKSYEADCDAALLRSLVDDGIRITEVRTTGLIFLVIVLATVPFTFILVRTRRSITSSLSNLSKGASAIGSGNLDFKIEEKRNDEIGDLSHAFNRMTADLKTVTASKTDLEREIDERKKAEDALRETRDYLENLFNYANAPIIVWNPEFEITQFNHAFEQLTGRSAEEVLGKKLDILFPADSRDESMKHIQRAVAGERWEVVEIPILHRNGTVRILLWNSATLYTPDSKTAVATIAQGQDITERKQAEEELKQRTAELEVSNKELEAFSYSVSHDLRAPLRSMEGFSNALLEDCADNLDDQGKQYLKYVQESSDLMARLIDDLLKLSRVTRSEMNYERVNLSELARNIMAELEKAEPQRKVKVSITSDITAYGDRNLLRLALENLLGNAWKFSSKVGSPRIEMGVLEYNDKQAYYVRDNGVGFDMTYVDKLFKPFQRLHKASEFAGTGIGLATVQRIIRRHGGEVWAESKVGEGATFYFTLG